MLTRISDLFSGGKVKLSQNHLKYFLHNIYKMCIYNKITIVSTHFEATIIQLFGFLYFEI